jgi:hypothetical protein
MQCNVMGCTVFDATQNNGVVTEYESPGPATPGAERQVRCGFACRVRWDIDKLMIHDDMIVDISHRIHGAAIYGDIYHQYTPVMLVYIPYMDPMGFWLDTFFETQAGHFLGISCYTLYNAWRSSRNISGIFQNCSFSKLRIAQRMIVSSENHLPRSSCRLRMLARCDATAGNLDEKLRIAFAIKESGLSLWKQNSQPKVTKPAIKMQSCFFV